jgi:acyl-CoA synthetase (AMP-forming)/AMP-acid ligase II
LEEKDSLREDAVKKREKEKRRLVMKIQDLEEGRKLIASMEQEQETDSLLKLSEDRRNDVEEVNRTLREELAQLKISL